MKRAFSLPSFLVTLLLLMASNVLHADVITLKNGDRITGDISSIWDDKLTIEPDYADEFDVDLDEIASVETDKALTVEMYDGRESDYTFAGINEQGQFLLEDAAGTVTTVEYFNLKRVEEVEEAFDWEVRTDYSSSLSKGNTDSHAHNLTTTLEYNVEDRRHIYELDMTREEVSGVDTQDNDTLNYTFNWVFNDPWFLAANATYEQDAIALVDYRISANPALGYDVWDEPHRTLNVQAGPGYQTEKIDGQTQTSTLLDWRLRFAYDLFSDDLELYHNHRLYQNYGGRDNLVFNSTTGLRYEFNDDTYVNLELNYDTDSNPANGKASENSTLLVGAGLKFD